MAIRDDDEGHDESDRESILGAEDGESKVCLRLHDMIALNMIHAPCLK